MKKILILIYLIFLVSCNNRLIDGIYIGEYQEKTQYITYNVKVKITVKNDKIKEITLLKSNVFTDPELWEGYMLWVEHHEALLNSYVGIDVNDILNSEEPILDAINGATLSSNRLYYAVRDALLV